jgi:hypothetical protein
MKWILAFLLWAVAGFCLFGFLATFEPGAGNAIAFRATYTVGGIVCIASAVVLVASRRKP